MKIVELKICFLSLWMVGLTGVSLQAASNHYTCQSDIEVFTPPVSGEVCTEEEGQPQTVNIPHVKNVIAPLHENLPAVRQELFGHLKRQAILDQLKNFFKARDKNSAITNDQTWTLDLLPSDIQSCVNSFSNPSRTTTDDHDMDVAGSLNEFISRRNAEFINLTNSQFNGSKLGSISENQKNYIEASEKLIQIEAKLSILNSQMAAIKAKVPPHLLLSGAWEPGPLYVRARDEADTLTFLAYHIKNRYPILSTAYLNQFGVELRPPREGETGIPLYKIISIKMNDHRENPKMNSFGRKPMDWISAYIQNAAAGQENLAMMTLKGDPDKKIEGLCHMSYTQDNFEHLVMADGLREKVLKAHENDPIFREVACEVVRKKLPDDPSWLKTGLYLGGAGLGCTLGWFVSGPGLCIGIASGVGTVAGGYEGYAAISRALDLNEDMPYIHGYFLSSADDEVAMVSAESFIKIPKAYNDDMFWGSVNLMSAGVGALPAGKILFLNRMAVHSRKTAEEAARLASMMRAERVVQAARAAKLANMGEGPSEIAAQLFIHGTDEKALNGFMKFVDMMDETTRLEFQDTIGALTKKSLQEGLDDAARLAAKNKAIKMLQIIDDNPHLTPREIERMLADELPLPQSGVVEPNLALRNAGGVRVGVSLPEKVASGKVGVVEYTGAQRGMQGTWNVQILSESRIKVFRVNPDGLRQESVMSRESFRNSFRSASSTEPSSIQISSGQTASGQTSSEMPTNPSPAPRAISRSTPPRVPLSQRIKSGDVIEITYLGKRPGMQGTWTANSMDRLGTRFRITQTEGGQKRAMIITRSELNGGFQAIEMEIEEVLPKTPSPVSEIPESAPSSGRGQVRGRHGAYDYYSADAYVRQGTFGDEVIIQTSDGISHRVQFLHSGREVLTVRNPDGTVFSVSKNDIESIRKSIFSPNESWRVTSAEIIDSNLSKINSFRFQDRVAQSAAFRSGEPLSVRIYVNQNTGEILDYAFSLKQEVEDAIVYAPNVRTLTIKINPDKTFSLPPSYIRDLTPAAFHNLQNSLQSAKYWQPSSY